MGFNICSIQEKKLVDHLHSKICCHEQNRCLRDLEQELRFFETNEYEGESHV